MGEQMELVAVKLPHEVIDRLDREVAAWKPFITKRGPMARSLVEIALACIDAGIVQRRPMAEQVILGKTAVAKATELPELTRNNQPVEDLMRGMDAIARRRRP